MVAGIRTNCCRCTSLSKTVKGVVTTMHVGADIKRGTMMDPVAKQKERIKVRARWKVSKLKCMKRERIDSVNDDETTITRWLWWTGRTVYYWPWSNVTIKSKLIRSRAEFDCTRRYFCDDKISFSRIRLLCETRREFFADATFPFLLDRSARKFITKIHPPPNTESNIRRLEKKNGQRTRRNRKI